MVFESKLLLMVISPPGESPTSLTVTSIKYSLSPSQDPAFSARLPAGGVHPGSEITLTVKSITEPQLKEAQGSNGSDPPSFHITRRIFSPSGVPGGGVIAKIPVVGLTFAVPINSSAENS